MIITSLSDMTLKPEVPYVTAGVAHKKYCLFVYSHMSNFSATRRLSPLLVTGLQIYAWA
jgi:hypothetical protein